MSKKLVILGAGESGVGAALLGKIKGWNVWVTDSNNINENYRQELVMNNIEFEEGGHSYENIMDAELVIKSPGIPEKTEVIKTIRSNNIPVISEIEFAFRYKSGKVIAITGSNGKTTTTLLCHHLLETCGCKVAVGGNVGKSYARILSGDIEYDYYVIEVSSFQLDDVEEFKPDISILLNITADHLDRYSYSIDLYAASKMNICHAQDSSDLLIYNSEDALIKQRLSSSSELIAVSPEFQNVGVITTSIGSEYSISEAALKGKHNQFNMTCALEAAEYLGMKSSCLLEGLKSFKNVAHRLERIAIIDGVEFINDSKATNVDAVYYALDAQVKPIIWIVGGVDKGNDYEVVMDLVNRKVKAVVCLGAENSKLKESFNDKVKAECQDVKYAIENAMKYAEEGDVVLLSPACASFDLFSNYIDRGDQFKNAVWQLSEKNKT